MAATLTLSASFPAVQFSREASAPAMAPSSAARRPKLSLDTACSNGRSLGRGNTGLRLDTIAAASSPTMRNTYRNTYDGPNAVSSASSSSSPQRVTGGEQPAALPYRCSPHPLHIHREQSPSGNSTSSTSSAEGSPSLPYSHANHPHPILRNTPLPRKVETRRTFGGSSGHRQLFHPTRRVAFRSPIAEDVRNARFTLKHSDILDRAQSPKVTEPRGTKRDSPSPTGASADDEEEDESAYAKTPVAGRNKKRREWVWTIDSTDDTIASVRSEHTGKKVDGR